MYEAQGSGVAVSDGIRHHLFDEIDIVFVPAGSAGTLQPNAVRQPGVECYYILVPVISFHQFEIALSHVGGVRSGGGAV